MEEKATMSINNITPVSTFRYGDDVKTYFLPEAVEAAKDYYLDNTLKIVMYKTGGNMAEEEESDMIDLNISL